MSRQHLQHIQRTLASLRLSLWHFPCTQIVRALSPPIRALVIRKDGPTHKLHCFPPPMGPLVAHVSQLVSSECKNSRDDILVLFSMILLALAALLLSPEPSLSALRRHYPKISNMTRTYCTHPKSVGLLRNIRWKSLGRVRCVRIDWCLTPP
jgi:hypothetical protein